MVGHPFDVLKPILGYESGKLPPGFFGRQIVNQQQILNFYFFCLRGDFLPAPLFAFAAPLSIAKCSRFLPFLISAAIHLGIAPRPAHVSDRFFGLRYFNATFRPFILLTPRLRTPDCAQLCG
jgi:hypothetical protein